MFVSADSVDVDEVGQAVNVASVAGDSQTDRALWLGCINVRGVQVGVFVVDSQFLGSQRDGGGHRCCDSDNREFSDIESLQPELHGVRALGDPLLWWVGWELGKIEIKSEQECGAVSVESHLMEVHIDQRRAVLAEDGLDEV